MQLPPIKLTKVTREHAKVLQYLVCEYLDEQEKDLQKQASVRFYSALQETALLVELFLILRSKIESRKPKFGLSLKCQQAVTLFFACNHAFKIVTDKESYVYHCAQCYLNNLDKALKSVNIPRDSETTITAASLELAYKLIP